MITKHSPLGKVKKEIRRKNGMLAMLCILLCGCASPKVLSIEYPPGTNQFVEITENEGEKTYIARVCNNEWNCTEEVCIKELVCTEQVIKGNPELDSQWNDYWRWYVNNTR